MQSLDSSNIKNKRVILRVDFNVPIDKDGNVEDTSRIVAAKKTLDFLLQNNCHVILISYLGRPEGYDQKLSLKPIIKVLQSLFPEYNTVFIENFLQDDSAILAQKENQIILFENIRFHPEEQSNDQQYIQKIASYGDVFINDSFSVSHREEATITGLPTLLPSYAGFQLQKEVMMLQKALGGKGRPRVTILGGAKVSTKIKLIEKFITSSDHILLGGALANTFLAATGMNMEKSLYEKNHIETAKNLIELSRKSACDLLLPTDFITNEEGAILDIGTETVLYYAKIIAEAHTIIWNGPMGYYEDPRYRAGSDDIFTSIAANHNALSIIGGGDTLLVLENKSTQEKDSISHISTGGGAMLEYIENGTLPGIEALNNSK